MYSDWTNLLSGEPSSDRNSVLERLPSESAIEVVQAVSKHIVTTLGISRTPELSPFTTDSEVEWCLQVVCYGLSLPLTDHDIIKDCVNIYCEWLTCLGQTPKISVPRPIIERPNFYARKMINHLYHLFTPRKGEGHDIINRQTILCHRVLRTLHNLVKTSDILDSETWECVLLFLISISDAILSPPASDIGDQLCERVLGVLFEVWLLSCSKCFPSPSLWKTLRESCRTWRHRANLFEQWNRINLFLAARVLKIMYGEDFLNLEESDVDLIPEGAPNDCIVQTWFRFLHSVGNPVELTQPTIISQTQAFLQYAIASKDVVDPCQHPCLSILPSIFQKAMSGISVIVDAFLGIPPTKMVEQSLNSSDSVFELPTLRSSVPPMRRLAKSFSIAPSSNVYKGLPRSSILSLATGRSKQDVLAQTQTSPPISSSTPSNSSSSLMTSSVTSIEVRPLPASARPKINSILHLFGPWLFEASLVSSDVDLGLEMRRTSRGSVPAALPENIDIPLSITIDKYYEGRAEALGILCRIFSSKKTGEEIIPAYLARFYITVTKGLKDSRSEVVNAIISNSWNLLRVDLDGVSMLIPVFLTALEGVLPTKETVKCDLRRSAIQLLLSILPLPLHFMNLHLKELADRSLQGMTFMQLKVRLANLLINTLQIETDAVNLQLLLSGLMCLVVDTATYEDVDTISANYERESPLNLMSSENASMRSVSDYSSFDEHVMIGLNDTLDGQSDSAHALFIRGIYLVCHRLISTWKADMSVSLAALELLTTFSRVRIHDQDPTECRRAVKWICDFIIQQCSRPPQAHSKDLHSCIVAAFQCITTWLIEHPHLLEDRESLYIIMEVVEYGISGTKSQGKPGEDLKLKDQKDLKPVSLRVRDAAESLLAVVFEQVGPSTGTKMSCQVDENILLKQLSKRNELTGHKMSDVVQQFRYFVIDNSILIALLECPMENGNPPSIGVILRSPTGRHAWSMQLRHVPRSKEKLFASNSVNPGRPLPMNDVGLYHNVEHVYFPEATEQVVQCKADKAIPTLEAISGQDSYEESRLSMMLENQIHEEKRIVNALLKDAEDSFTNPRVECAPPTAAENFQTARLLLSNFGLLSFQEIGNGVSNSSKLAAIDAQHSAFPSELQTLDATGSSTYDTAHVFYVRAGQKIAMDILRNVEAKGSVHHHFLEFLLSLGRPAFVAKHSGWTGNVATSWNGLGVLDREKASKQFSSTDKVTTNTDIEHGGSLYNGDTQILYWADVTSEIAFVVPTRKNEVDSGKMWSTTGTAVLVTSGSSDRTHSGGGGEKMSRSSPLPHTTSLDSADKHQPSPEAIGDDIVKARKLQATKMNDSKIFIVWLESFEDSLTFPANELLSYTCTGLDRLPVDPSLIIFIHSLRNGLFRIHIDSQSLRMGMVTPLCDGAIVSRRALGNLVRQTSLNVAKRRRLENENFQPPHVRRKVKIQEILHKFPRGLTEPRLYAHFFHDVPDRRQDHNSNQ